jgi:hypothetical protein
MPSPGGVTRRLSVREVIQKTWGWDNPRQRSDFDGAVRPTLFGSSKATVARPALSGSNAKQTRTGTGTAVLQERHRAAFGENGILCVLWGLRRFAWHGDG